MRKWKTRAAPDDPNVWADVSGMWPTTQLTYEVADIYGSPSTITATGETSSTSAAGAAWAFKVLSGQRAYVVGNGGKVWEYSGGTLTDRTGGITVTSVNHMAQYGNITILARGTTQSLASSSGGNFAALAGSPSAKIAVVQSNAVVCFNTSVSSDGWATSDVGDYTNWSTGEAASGRILEGNGPITAAVPFGGDIIVFKTDAIFRMTYVGGVVKWLVQKIWAGTGCAVSGAGESAAEACGDCIVFLGAKASSSLFVPDKPQIYRFDGSSAPRLINPDHGFDSLDPIPMYDPTQRRVMFLDFNAANVVPLFYSLDFDAWGRGVDLFASVGQIKPLPLRGEYSAANAMMAAPFHTTARLIFYDATDSFKLLSPNSPGGSTASTAYVQTSKIGQADRKTTFTRLTPLLRRRVNNSGGSPACSLSATFYRERHDTSAATTKSVTEASDRKRFNFLESDNFAQFKVTFADMDAEIDDVLVGAVAGGKD